MTLLWPDHKIGVHRCSENFPEHLKFFGALVRVTTDSRFSKTWNLEVLILKSWNLESRLDNSRFQDFKITASRFQVFKIDIFCYFQTFLIVLKSLYLSQPREPFTYFANFLSIISQGTLGLTPSYQKFFFEFIDWN